MCLCGVESVQRWDMPQRWGGLSLFLIAMLANRLASLYLAAPAAEPSAAELSALRQWIAAEFAAIPPKVRFTADDVPPELMTDVYRELGMLLISTAHNSHPLLTEQQNAQFRAVHDWHHVRAGAGFDMAGEIQAFKTAAQSAPMAIRWMLHSEIVLQAAACIATGKFQPQKLVRC